MNSFNKEARLYGIINSNRNGDNLWGKNQFNSTFPVSLACYMRDAGIKPVYLRLNSELKVELAEISFDEVFNTTLSNSDLYFGFESKYKPYELFAYDDIGNIDLVVKHGADYLRPLEIKLTVVPDHTTHKLIEEKWAPELVIRPASTIYSALGIAESCKMHFNKVREIFEPACHHVRDWGNEYEIGSKMKGFLDSLDDFQKEFHNLQKPFLMQPIWRTQGKSPLLADDAFDIFIWSDFALCRLFIDASRKNLSRNDAKLALKNSTELHSVGRLMRSSARFIRFLYQASTSSKVNIKHIYTEMAHNRQTDKEFALSGIITRNYLCSPRLIKPILGKTILKEIILNGGEKKLSPERRFDQTIYYSAAQLFDDLKSVS